MPINILPRRNPLFIFFSYYRASLGDLFIQITTKRHYLDEKAKISPTNILLIRIKYTGPIKINKDTVLKFMAVDASGNKSEIFTEKYRIFKVAQITDQSKEIIGKALPNSTVRISFGDKELMVTADENGQFVAAIDRLSAGTKVYIFVIDEDGTESEKLEMEVLDVTPPDAPIVEDVTDQSTAVTGEAEAGATVIVKANGKEIGRTAVSGDGSFRVEIPVQKADTELIIIVKDSAGNESEAVKVKVRDVTPPSAPTVSEVTDQSTAVTGEAEAGATVIVEANGKEIGRSTVSGDGSFRVEIPVQKANTELTVIVKDLAGNVSKPTKLRVKDVTPPFKPLVNEVTDQSTIVTGRAEADSTVIVQVDGHEIGRATANEDGTYEVSIPIQSAGTEISVLAVDGAGNKSETATVTVKDVTPPEKPVVNPVSDLQKELIGKAEPGATLIIKASGKEIGRGTVDSNGNFKVKISKQKAGTVLEIFVQDKAGNISEPAKVTVSDEKPKLEKLVGKTRFTTAVEISRMGWEKADTVLLVNGWAMADGLTATPLASAYNAPILLTRLNSIPEETMEEIKRLGAKRIILIGGSGVISNAIQDNLKKSGYGVTRIGGKTRYDTSLLIAKELDKLIDVHTVYIAYGYGEPDALSIAAKAGETKQPIILTSKNYLPDETYKWLKGENIKTAYFIGGKGVISQAIINQTNQITAQNVLGNRISGVDRQETNAKVISAFYQQSEIPTILVAHANTDKLVDALAAGPLGAKLRVPVLLVSNKGLADLQAEAIKNLVAEKVHQVGGGIPEPALNRIIDLVNAN